MRYNIVTKKIKSLKICPILTVIIFSILISTLYNHRASIIDKVDSLISSINQYRIKTYLDKNLPELASMDDYHKATLLRNFLYSSVSLGQINSAVQPRLTYNVFLKYINGDEPLLCGGISILYKSLLRLYGINSRLINMSTKKPSSQINYDTHATVEVFLNHHWILEDPTFNIHWELNGKPLSTSELAKAFSKKQKPLENSDGYPLIANRRIRDYYLPYQKLLNYYEVFDYSQSY